MGVCEDESFVFDKWFFCLNVFVNSVLYKTKLVIYCNCFPLGDGGLWKVIFLVNELCHFLCLDANKVTKEKSRQTRSLRAFCRPCASPCVALFTDIMLLECSVIIFCVYFFYNVFDCLGLYASTGLSALLIAVRLPPTEQSRQTDWSAGTPIDRLNVKVWMLW